VSKYIFGGKQRILNEKTNLEGQCILELDGNPGPVKGSAKTDLLFHRYLFRYQMNATKNL